MINMRNLDLRRMPDRVQAEFRQLNNLNTGFITTGPGLWEPYL